MTAPILRIGTRGSPLALAQTESLCRALAAAHPELAAPDAMETVVIRTTGDKVRDRTLAAIGGKGLFTKEIEEALARGAIDLAAHSLKDVPTVLPAGLLIACHLPRADPRDAFISRRAKSLAELPSGAVLGTASLRRSAQVLAARRDLTVVPLRGNVDTRLRKLDEGKMDATILALAGLQRLGLAEAATAILPPELMLPAPAQGVIGIEARRGDTRVMRWLAGIDDSATSACARAERALLAALDGSCRTPIAALAEIVDGKLRLRARILLPDGTRQHDGDRLGVIADAERLGHDLGAELRATAGPGFFDLPIPEGIPV
ncbi:MAG TPA: hydroxymethylbilane synthase [Stellaceae bacterium]|nr:hydroxymethylbilane synthase [Stellaceae bacterium]